MDPCGLTAIQAVKLGVDPTRESTRVSSNLMNKRMRGGISSDRNHVKFKMMDGRRWYTSCKSSMYNYWDKDETRRHPRPSDIGLPASIEWNEWRKKCYMVLACTNPRTKVGANDLRYYTGRMNMYTIVRDEADLVNLYSAFPPADRFFQEVVMPEMPHKCFMDIECDYFDEVDEKDIKARIEHLTDGVTTMFIPKLCDFFNNELGVPVRPSDCYVMEANRMTSKFSVHLVVSTPRCHYFETRSDSWIAMVLLVRYLLQRAEADADFHDWLLFKNEKGQEDLVWDFGIYGRGARNMRMLGACKADKLALGTSWERCRVFKPIARQENANWTHFVASVQGIPSNQREKIELSQPLLVKAANFAQYMHRRMSEDTSALLWFRNSKNVITEIRRRNVSLPDNFGRLRGPRSSRVGGNVANSHSGLPVGDQRLIKIREGIDVMGQANRMRVQPVFQDMAEHDTRLYNRFMDMACNILRDVCEAIHPGSPVVPHLGSESCVFTATVSCKVQGHFDPSRMCFFGCTQGSHMARLDVMTDLSVTYMCYACRQKEIVLDSCFRPGMVPPRCEKSRCPPDFAHGFIDYALVRPEVNEHATFMRPIRTVGERRHYMPDVGHQRTEILMGSMGSGKTHVVEKYVEEVRAEEPGAFMIAISFRKMLAKMFAERFRFVMYTSSDEYSLYDEQYLACQIESLYRLTKSPGSDDNEENANTNQAELNQELQSTRERIMRKTFDVVIIDEIESALAHLTSQTLETRINCIWKILVQIVRNCRTLIVCDADIGPRTFSFLRMTRKRVVGDEAVVENLYFHCNRHISIQTRFYDYLSEFKWYEELKRRLLVGQNVFYFSNIKKHMRAIKSMLVHDLTALKRQELLDNHDVEYIDAVLMNILVIDADVTESAKMMYAECNQVWTQYKLVMISPTVGAGIDFTERHHFHVTFGYAGRESVSPRGWNQMRGRVRYPSYGECHVFIDEAADPASSAALSEMIRDELAAPGFSNEEVRGAERIREPVLSSGPFGHINESGDGEGVHSIPGRDPDSDEESLAPPSQRRRLEEVPGDRPIADSNFVGQRDEVLDDVPVTLHAAMEFLARKTRLFLQDDIEFRRHEERGVEQLSMNRVVNDQGLCVIMALNTVEQNRGRVCFRAELIRVLQSSNPDVQYSFVTGIDIDLERAHNRRVVDFTEKNNKKRRRTVAGATDLGYDETRELFAKDRVGAGLDEYPVFVASHMELFSVEQKNHVKHFYGLVDNIAPEVWEQVMRIAGDEETMSQVREFAYILGSDFMNLELHDVHRGALRGCDITLVDQDLGLGDSRRVRCRTMGSEETWPSRKSKRRNLWKLLWAAGFDVPSPFAAANFPPMSILPGLGCGSGHSFVSEERLKNPALVSWLKQSYSHLHKELCGNSLRGGRVKPNEAWNFKKVMKVVKVAFKKTLNLELLLHKRRKKKRVGDDGEDDGALDEDELEEVDALDACPEVENCNNLYVPEKKCALREHKEGGFKCGALLHVPERSLAIMLSLVWLYVHARARKDSGDKTLVEAVKKEVDRVVEEWGRQPLFFDYSVHGEKVRRLHERRAARAASEPHRPEPREQVVPDTPEPQEQASPETQDTEDCDEPSSSNEGCGPGETCLDYGNMAGYGTGDYGDFGGYGTGDYGDEGDQGNYDYADVVEEDSVSVAPVSESLREMDETSRHVSESGITDDMSEVSFQGFNYSQEEEDLEMTTRRLSQLQTTQESSFSVKKAMVGRPLDQKDRDKFMAEKNEILGRFLGPNPYTLPARRFVSMLLTPAYEGRRQRQLLRFRAEAAVTMQNHLEAYFSQA